MRFRWGVTAVAVVAALVGPVPEGAGASTVPVARRDAAVLTASVPSRALHVVAFNLLHGIFCEPGTNDCQSPDRVELFLREAEEAGCPQVIGLQEINQNLDRLIRAAVGRFCGGAYTVVFGPAKGLDTELVLTTLPVVKRSAKVVRLPGGQRTASRVVLRGPEGRVVVVVTHQNGDSSLPQCNDTVKRYRCPPPCENGMAFTFCETVMAAALAEAGGTARTTHILMGDFNIDPTTARYRYLADHGWIDSYLAAGRPECDPATGIGCTSGRDDMHLGALKDPNAREHERIDFVFVKPPTPCDPSFGPRTGLFADQPALNGPGALVWPSDHTGVSMELTCT